MEKYNITLAKDHLLILSDLIHRISKSEILNNFFVDDAEKQAIWHLDWLLEKETPNILAWEYLDELKKARDSYRHSE